MRSLLSVKWKLIFAVIGVSLVSLIGLLLMNLRAARQYSLAGSRSLLRGAASLEAMRYNQASEGMSSTIDAVQVLLQAELEQAKRNKIPPDAERLAQFARLTIENSTDYLKGLGIVLEPGVFPVPKRFSRFSNSAGFTVIKYSSAPGFSMFMKPDSLDFVMDSEWWSYVKSNEKGIISEPYLDEHATPRNTERHVEARLVQPVQLDGKFIGVIWLEMCLTRFAETLTNNQNGGKIAFGVLVSPNGATVGRPGGLDVSSVIYPSDTELSTINTDAHPEIMDAVRKGEEYSATLRLGAGERRVQVATMPIEVRGMDTLWSVLLFRPEDYALAGYSGTFERFSNQGLVMLLVSGFLGYLVWKFMGRGFMANEIWHRTILDRLPLPLAIFNDQSVWVYANPAIARVLGTDNPAAFVGRTAEETMPARTSNFVKRTNTPTAADIEKKEVMIEGPRYHTLSSCRLVDPDGKYVGRLLIGVDVTDARNITKTLAAATAIARSLDARSERILSSAQSLSNSAMEKSAAIEEITATTQRIGESAVIYADSARDSYTQAEDTHGASDRGAVEAQEVAEAMAGVRESGKKIRSVIRLIDDIAFQTNLLSLNAAVEAARAGRNGRGFAVVADEVRNLAGRSATAAKETTQMIEEMAKRIGGAATSIERLVGTLGDISASAEILRTNSDKVARLADEQSYSVRQVHVSLEEISRAVNATITVSRETADMAEAILQQAATLRRVTETGDAESRDGSAEGAVDAVRPAAVDSPATADFPAIADSPATADSKERS